MEPLSREEIESLSDLYDRFAHALDPFSEERDRAEIEFYRRLEILHAEISPATPFAEFRREAVRACKLFLRRNQS